MDAIIRPRAARRHGKRNRYSIRQTYQSPVLDSYDTAVVLNQQSLDKFESKVKPGGTLIYDPSGIHRTPERTDIKVVSVDATGASIELNNSKTYNMILLGALLKLRPIVGIDAVLRGLKKTLPERHHHLLPPERNRPQQGYDFSMNILRITAAAAALAAAVLCNAADWAQYGRYAAANDSVRAAANDGSRVVFLGNSITDNWARYTPFFGDNGFIGRGISGQTTYQFLARFYPDVVELQPAVVVINGGTNDVAENTCRYNEDTTFNNIVAMVNIARRHGIRPVMTAVLPAAQFSWRKEISDAPEKIKALNKRLKSYADAEGIPFVDYYTILVDADGRTLPETYSYDGVHPTVKGYLVMEAAVLPIVREQLKP